MQLHLCFDVHICRSRFIFKYCIFRWSRIRPVLLQIYTGCILVGSCHHDNRRLRWHEVNFFQIPSSLFYFSKLMPISSHICIDTFRCGAFFERGLFCRSRLGKFLLQEYSRCFLVGCSHHDHSGLWWHDVRIFLVHFYYLF